MEQASMSIQQSYWFSTSTFKQQFPWSTDNYRVADITHDLENFDSHAILQHKKMTSFNIQRMTEQGSDTSFIITKSTDHGTDLLCCQISLLGVQTSQERSCISSHSPCLPAGKRRVSQNSCWNKNWGTQNSDSNSVTNFHKQKWLLHLKFSHKITEYVWDAVL